MPTWEKKEPSPRGKRSEKKRNRRKDQESCANMQQLVLKRGSGLLKEKESFWKNRQQRAHGQRTGL